MALNACVRASFQFGLVSKVRGLRPARAAIACAHLAVRDWHRCTKTFEEIS